MIKVFKHVPLTNPDDVYGVIIIHEKYDYKKFNIIFMDKNDIEFFINIPIDDWFDIIGGECSDWLKCIGREDLCNKFKEPEIIVQGFYEWNYNGSDYREFVKFLNEGNNAVSILRQVPKLPEWVMRDIKAITNRGNNRC